MQAFQRGKEISRLPYGSAEDANQWALWYSMLDFLNIPNGKIKSLGKSEISRIKQLAKESKPKQLSTGFDLERIESKRDFDQLLSFELFDFDRHSLDADDLFRLFTF